MVVSVPCWPTSFACVAVGIVPIILQSHYSLDDGDTGALGHVVTFFITQSLDDVLRNVKWAHRWKSQNLKGVISMFIKVLNNHKFRTKYYTSSNQKSSWKNFAYNMVHWWWFEVGTLPKINHFFLNCCLVTWIG